MSDIIDDLEKQFAPIAHEYCLRMELVEACDWDEDAALELYEQAYTAMKDLWEYSKHDAGLIKNNSDFVKLLKTNLPVGTTDHQADTVAKILDYYLESAHEKAKNGGEDDKKCN